MWDGRESFAPHGHDPDPGRPRRPTQNAAALFDDLKHQANDATRTHAQGAAPLTDDVAEAIVQFELNLATAQQKLHHVGELDAHGAQGGPAFVAVQPFYVTINDVLGADTSGAAVQSGRDDALRRLGRLRTSADGPRSPAAPSSSARSRSTSRASAA